MKKTILIVLFACFAAISFSQDKKLGLGVILYEPTGISGKMWTGETTAFDAAAGWSLGSVDVLHLHADFLAHRFDLINVNKGRLPLYFGIGAKLVLADDPRIGIRVPVGLSYLFSDAPLDAFLEIVPTLDLIPSTDFDIDGALGLRYYF
ncbi:MAG: hypothetical protein JXA77_00780 [Bacteroidales bacterium]|nr:hypothetical protein [Bacteroidales bacterium]MBN2820797.1 hypothetical protein [Bacteroidales bacterium]